MEDCHLQLQHFGKYNIVLTWLAYFNIRKLSVSILYSA